MNKITIIILALLLLVVNVNAVEEGVCRFGDSDGNCIIGPEEIRPMDACIQGLNPNIIGGYSCNDIFDLDGDGFVSPADNRLLDNILQNNVNDLGGCPKEIIIDYNPNMYLNENQNISFYAISRNPLNTKRKALGIEYDNNIYSTGTSGIVTINYSPSEDGNNELAFFIKGNEGKTCNDITKTISINVLQEIKVVFNVDKNLINATFIGTEDNGTYEGYLTSYYNESNWVLYGIYSDNIITFTNVSIDGNNILSEDNYISFYAPTIDGIIVINTTNLSLQTNIEWVKLSETGCNSDSTKEVVYSRNILGNEFTNNTIESCTYTTPSSSSSGGSSGTNRKITSSYDLTCYQEWECNSWGDCINGMQSRSCYDKHKCTGCDRPNTCVLKDKPIEQKECKEPTCEELGNCEVTIEPETNYDWILGLILTISIIGLGILVYLKIKKKKAEKEFNSLINKNGNKRDAQN